MSQGESTMIHPTAVVNSGAELGEGVRVGPYCVIGDEVRIGAGTMLQSHVSVEGPTTIGSDCVVYPFAVLGAEPQDLKYHGERTELIVGDRCQIREHATIHRGTIQGGGKTVVGSGCLLMVGAHVAHDCVIEDEVVIANSVMLGGHCLVEYGATIAGGAGIHHFATVGRLSFVGGLARITKDVPPFLIVEGSPAEPRKVNTTAMARRGIDSEEIEAMRSAYKSLYRSDCPIQTTIQRLRAEGIRWASVEKLCDALEAISLGVHGRRRESMREPQTQTQPERNG